MTRAERIAALAAALAKRAGREPPKPVAASPTVTVTPAKKKPEGKR